MDNQTALQREEETAVPVDRDLTMGGSVAANLRQIAPAEAIGEGWKAVSKVNSTRQANHHQAGFRAEHFHEATFNADAARKGATVRAQVTKPGSPADLQLVKGQEVVAKVQVKNCQSVAETTKAVAQSKYDGMQRVVPADQADQVRTLAAKRGIDGLGERNYQETSQTASARIEADGVKSRDLTYDQAQDRRLGVKMVSAEIGTAAKSGAQNGAIIGGAVSAVSNIKAVLKKEKGAATAVKDVAKDASLAAAGGAVSAAVTGGIAAGCAKAGLKAISRSGAPGAIATAGIEVTKDLVALRKGQLSRGQVIERSVEHAATAGGGWGGASAGAALGTCLLPGVGTVVGGVLGGMLGSAGGRQALHGVKWLLSEDPPALQDTTVATI